LAALGGRVALLAIQGLVFLHVMFEKAAGQPARPNGGRLIRRERFRLAGIIGPLDHVAEPAAAAEEQAAFGGASLLLDPFGLGRTDRRGRRVPTGKGPLGRDIRQEIPYGGLFSYELSIALLQVCTNDGRCFVECRSLIEFPNCCPETWFDGIGPNTDPQHMARCAVSLVVDWELVEFAFGVGTMALSTLELDDLTAGPGYAPRLHMDFVVEPDLGKVWFAAAKDSKFRVVRGEVVYVLILTATLDYLWQCLVANRTVRIR
jgi:hypothetical protein